MTWASTRHVHQRARVVSPSVGVNEWHGQRGLKVLATGIALLLGHLRHCWVVYVSGGLTPLLGGLHCCWVICWVLAPLLGHLHRCWVIYTVVGSSTLLLGHRLGPCTIVGSFELSLSLHTLVWCAGWWVTWRACRCLPNKLAAVVIWLWACGSDW